MKKEQSNDRRNKDGRFKKGVSGNPKGRPRKQRRFVVPDQIRRDVITQAEKLVQIRTENGVECMTQQEVVVMRIVQGAMIGKPTALKLWMQLYTASVQERIKAHRGVELTSLLRQISEQPGHDPTPEELKSLDSMIKHIKKMV